VRNWEAKKYQLCVTADDKELVLRTSEIRTHFIAGIDGKEAKTILRKISDTIYTIRTLVNRLVTKQP